MPKTGVSYEQVTVIADYLVSLGVVPTNREIRNQLGTGSDSTIQKHMKLWRENFTVGLNQACADILMSDGSFFHSSAETNHECDESIAYQLKNVFLEDQIARLNKTVEMSFFMLVEFVGEIERLTLALLEQSFMNEELIAFYKAECQAVKISVDNQFH